MYTGCNDGSGDRDREFVIEITRSKITLQYAMTASRNPLREGDQAARSSAAADPLQHRGTNAHE
jgi:hypothetical protein